MRARTKTKRTVAAKQRKSPGTAAEAGIDMVVFRQLAIMWSESLKAG